MAETLCVKLGGATYHEQTYTFPSGDGATTDLGEEHEYRYVNAENVYSKGKVDSSISVSSCQNSQAGGTHSNRVSNPVCQITVPVTSKYGILICTSAIGYDSGGISASQPTVTCSRTKTLLTSHGVSQQAVTGAGAVGYRVCSWLVYNPVKGDVYKATFAGSHSSNHWNCQSGISYIPLTLG